jgi:hypothetical protein
VVVRVMWNVTWQGASRTGEVHGLATSAQRQLVVDEMQAVITG